MPQHPKLSAHSRRLRSGGGPSASHCCWPPRRPPAARLAIGPGRTDFALSSIVLRIYAGLLYMVNMNSTCAPRPIAFKSAKSAGPSRAAQ